ncbi:MAG: 4Fe-4S binding protein [Candidatus Woodwardiibium sp.]
MVRAGEERCHGCGACARVCYEGAIGPFGRQGAAAA